MLVVRRVPTVEAVGHANPEAKARRKARAGGTRVGVGAGARRSRTRTVRVDQRLPVGHEGLDGSDGVQARSTGAEPVRAHRLRRAAARTDEGAQAEAAPPDVAGGELARRGRWIRGLAKAEGPDLAGVGRRTTSVDVPAILVQARSAVRAAGRASSMTRGVGGAVRGDRERLGLALERSVAVEEQRLVALFLLHQRGVLEALDHRLLALNPRVADGADLLGVEAAPAPSIKLVEEA
mmetsp:Transcript_19368/g.73218  ORF Transcript_19368/g.73218 Transcript_19368/m.73218 type:complete len:236 (+) Transcript_19368:1140-1847(+)